jgi:AraC-like DNA-binding protein
MTLDLVIRAIAAVALATTAARAASRYREHPAGYPAVLLCFGLMAYLCTPLVMAIDRYSVVTLAAIAFAIANPPLIWLVARGLFREQAGIRRAHWAAIAGAVAIGLLFAYELPRRLFGDGPVVDLALWVLPRSLGLGFVLVALLEAWRDARNDLVEPRRFLRVQLVTAIAVYTGLVTVVEVALRGEPAPPAIERLHVGLLASVAIAASILVFRHGDSLFGRSPTVRSAAVDPLPQALDAWIAQRGFLAPDQSIKLLARTLGTQEYKLRRLLNGQLGFRNFNDFLHRHRIRVACDKLTQAGPALSILELSLDVGYSSLATFNRAFKEITTLTPTEYRLRNSSAKPTSLGTIS